jgi:hypothetical protein
MIIPKTGILVQKKLVELNFNKKQQVDSSLKDKISVNWEASCTISNAKEDKYAIIMLSMALSHIKYELNIKYEGKYRMEVDLDKFVVEDRKMIIDKMVNKLIPSVCELVAIITGRTSMVPVILSPQMPLKSDLNKS